MDHHGDHALPCKYGLRVVHRHNSLRTAITRSAIKPAGTRLKLEDASLVGGHNFRPANIVAQTRSPPAAETPSKSTAYDVTVPHSFKRGCILAAASHIAGAAELASFQKAGRRGRQLQEAGLASPDWDLVPVGSDTPGAPSQIVTDL